ncbi:MAG: manganese efflux pump, partial [Clostridia bacterium]
LLAIIGGKMIYDALSKKKETTVENADKLKIKELLILSIATSIDALAVGITLALLPSTNIFVAIAIIGVITFVLSFVGVIIGNKFGGKFEKKAEFVGGIILIGIGLKILIEHLIK